jgi:hypothetical protein
MRLAFDIGFRRLALRVEGVEVLFEALVAGDAGIDCAAQNRLVHGKSSIEAARTARSPTTRPTLSPIVASMAFDDLLV